MTGAIAGMAQIEEVAFPTLTSAEIALARSFGVAREYDDGEADYLSQRIRATPNVLVHEQTEIDTLRPITLCGELAGREAHVPRLVRMGFRALSVAPTVIPTTKALIRTLDISDGTAAKKP